METFFVDSGSPPTKQAPIAYISARQGKFRVEVKNHSTRHTDPQRKYYFGVICATLKEFFAQQGEQWTTDDAHEFLKSRELMVDVTNKLTGECMGSMPGSITKLDPSEMSAYIERCIALLANYSIFVPPAEVYR